MGQSGSASNRGNSFDVTPKDGDSGAATHGHTNSDFDKTSTHTPSPTTTWTAMDGPTYACNYLGYSTLSKPALNMAGLQQPVKEVYLKFRKQSTAGTAPRRASFKITPSGLLVTLFENGKQEMFFELNCVNFIEAVRFSVIKGSEKKPKAMFVPIDESRGPVSDKTAFSLDKSFHFLVQSGHPPMVVCVLRRPKGVKALDCHVFAVDAPEMALSMTSLVQQLQTPGATPKDMAPGLDPRLDSNFNRGIRGDVIRTEFGEYSVYRGQQPVELKDEHFRGGGGVGGGPGGEGGYIAQMDFGPRGGIQGNPRDTYPAETADRPRYGWSQPGDDFRTTSGQYGGDNRPLSGDPQFAAVERRPPNQYFGEGRPGNQYLGDRHSGGEYPGERHSGGDFGVGDPRGAPPYDQRQSGYRRQEFERTEVSHVREQSGDSSDNRTPALNRSLSGNSGNDRYYSDDGRQGFQPPQTRSDMPPKVMEKSQSPVNRPYTGSPTFPSGNPPANQQLLSPRRPPETQRPIVGGMNEGPVCSLSNRESRDDVEDVQSGKPVAKVPPHMKGVKVLPSDFLAVKLKPKQQRSESDENEPGYDNNKHIMEQYKQLQELESRKGVRDFDDGDFDKPSQQRMYNSNWSDDPKAAGPKPDYDAQYRRQTEEDRRYIEQYHGGMEEPMMRRPQGPRYDEPPMPSGMNRYSSPYVGAPPPQSGTEHWRSQSSYEMGQGYQRGGPVGPGAGAHPPNGAAGNDVRKKDAEIANMFSNVRLQGREPYGIERNNFEHSLGYLP